MPAITREVTVKREILVVAPGVAYTRYKERFQTKYDQQPREEYICPCVAGAKLAV